MLRSQIAGLGVPYGLERSCKLVAGGVFADRFLLSVHREALGPDPLRQILALLGPLGIPNSLPRQLEDAWSGAEVVHFGYEVAGGAEICKVYFEYVGNAQQALRDPQPRQPTLVHRAWKWRLPPTHALTATDYTWSRNAPGESVMGRIARLCEPAGADHVAARAAAAVRNLIGDRIAFDDLMLLEVREEGTVRHSFDLNLYPADLTMRAIAPVIDQIRLDLGLSAQSIRAVFDAVPAMTVGHISGGSGRDGDPFVTVYFGVEAC